MNLTITLMMPQVMGEEGARLILEQLEVRTTDRVVDMGAGTCVTAGMEQIFSRYSEYILKIQIQR